MSETNKHGLSRHLPSDVARTVRRNSKFGCVICRCGFYQYEHINPPFEDCKEHDPDKICCLCGQCHDAVTRGLKSKDAIKAAYKNIKKQSLDQVKKPIGPLDFYDGSAELVIGGLKYSPLVQSVLRYYGVDLIRVEPGKNGEPGSISAIFTDSAGNETLRLAENAWIGSMEMWDVEIKSRKITVRKAKGDIALALKLEPPGKLIIERLDMKFRDAHFIASDKTYALGRYITESFARWVYSPVQIKKSTAQGVVLELTDPVTLEMRDKQFSGRCVEIATQDRSIVANAYAGIMFKKLGISIASFTGAFELSELGASGDFRPREIRREVFKKDPDILRFFLKKPNS